MKNIFLEALLRLKQQAGVSSDKEVAALLGMSATSLNQRKARDAFPEKDLLVLCAKRPELNIDVSYVLTGQHTADKVAGMLANFPARLRELRGKRSSDDMATLLQCSVLQYAQIESGAVRPTRSFVGHLVDAHPERSAAWVMGGDAPQLDTALNDLEVILIHNYRQASPEEQRQLRAAAAAAISPIAPAVQAKPKKTAMSLEAEVEIDLVNDYRPNRLKRGQAASTGRGSLPNKTIR